MWSAKKFTAGVEKQKKKEEKETKIALGGWQIKKKKKEIRNINKN